MRVTKVLLSFVITMFSANSFAQSNTYTGVNAGLANTIPGTGNSGFGYKAMETTTSGGNSAFGFSAMANASGNNNCAFGSSALSINTGSTNSAFGFHAMKDATGGLKNVAIGAYSLFQNTGYGNVSIGYESMYFNTSGYDNTAIGQNAGRTLKGGSSNTYIGYSAGFATDSVGGRSNNVAVGKFAGFNVVGDNNVFLGSKSGYSAVAVNQSNKLYIHNSDNTNPLIYGEFDNRNLIFNVNKTTSYVRIQAANTKSGLQLPGLAASAITGKVLTIDSAGNVVLTTDQVGTGGSVNINAGANVTVSGNGSALTPYIIAASNIYTDNGALEEDRTIDLNGHNLHFQVSPTDVNGRMYIGDAASFPSTLPANNANYRLYVEGGVLTEKVKVALRSTTDWADYVFAKDYKLMPLNEVEAFIKENERLPNVASSEELSKTGLDLGEMQAKQMEKIEELTLYAIEQNKMLEKQSKEIEELKAQMKLLMERK